MDNRNLELVTELRHLLHSNPELSGFETETKKTLIAFLQRHTSLSIVDRGKWFYAVYKAGDSLPGSYPSLAFRADMDAVAVEENLDLPYKSKNPGVSHKCGHDGHCATLAGFALEVEQLKPQKNIYFLFQHAEENAGGAIECVSIFENEKIDEIFGLHNMPGWPKKSIVLREGTFMCASEGITATFTGTSTHASTPWKGINPAIALAETILEIKKISEKSLYKSMVLCTIIHSSLGTEGAFGVSASKASLSVTCRAEHDADIRALKERLYDSARAKAKEHSLTCEFSVHDSFPATVNSKAGIERVRQAAEKLGLPFIELDDPIGGSEDYGYFLQKTDGAFFFIGAGDHPGVHSWEYDFPDELIETGVEMFKALL
ncbi:MAG: M20 family metallopeptidase [Treponema sp.]|nr:M20 family metallopeptidase [Treponema sp.]